MSSISTHQKIIDKLYIIYEKQGYVSEDYIFDEVVKYDLPLEEVDHVVDKLLSIGVVIRDETEDELYDEKDVQDRSKIDYEELFRDVVSIDQSIQPFINKLREIKPPQNRECQNLMPQAKNNNQFAKERIIEMYLKIVVRIAYWYHQKYDFPLAETIQDGCIGLVIALDKYEIGKQEKFSIYAPWWIRQNILRRASIKNPLVYAPVYIKDKLFSIYNIIEDFCLEDYECKNNNSDLTIAVSKKLEFSQAQAEEYLGNLNLFLSLDQLMEENETVFNDCFMAEEHMIFELNKKEFHSTVTEIFKTFSPREVRVILLRFGFIDRKEWTLEEIGNEFGVTRERIRQIEAKAIRKIKHPSRIRILQPFLE
ncbi:sigma-70 family RNA polymerase sigma factor [Acetobacterium bakii]|nr:sigma-70 family RNA polymerase sigma factor [Acetobacterium bakii]